MNDILHQKYQVLVCGAGPAGLIAAWKLAQAGVKVALLDRRDPWREPVLCAEAVSKNGLLNIVPDAEAHWFRAPVNGVVFVAPNGTRVHYEQKDSGYILDRAAMHRSLAERVAQAGAHCNFRAHVKALHKQGGKWEALVNLGDGSSVSILADAVVDSTGAGGALTRNIPELVSLEQGNGDLESGVFTLIDGIEHENDYIQLYFGQKYFPGGYGWVFPRDGKTANVGIVLGKAQAKGNPARELLKQWVAETWPHAQMGSLFGGAIACGQSHRSIAFDGVFKAGDSAGHVNPISRSGIAESMKAGEIVARNLTLWLTADNAEKRRIENSLWGQWMEAQGQTHLRLARAKPAFMAIPDEVLDRAAAKIVKIPLAKRSLPRIFFTTLLRSPSLLWKMRSLMGF